MTNRVCGDCTLCCLLVPVVDLNKPAGVKCAHQCAAGCRIYDARPSSCRNWSCRWLTGDHTGRRPDRSHLVVDMLPDYIEVTDNETGVTSKVGVLQVWMDPRHPHAHHDPAFRAYIEQVHAETGFVALIRTSSHAAFVLAPPGASKHGEWWEGHAPVAAGNPEHSFDDVAATLGELGVKIVVQ